MRKADVAETASPKREGMEEGVVGGDVGLKIPPDPTSASNGMDA